MIKARITTQDEQGNQIHNVPVVLADYADVKAIQEIFENSITTMERLSAQIDALKTVVDLQDKKINLLTQTLTGDF